MAVTREFVSLTSASAGVNPAGYHPAQGLYWTPAGVRPKVAVIAAHYNVDFAEHYLAPLIAERGYGFLGWNTRYRSGESLFLLEHALADIAAGVAWLREQAGVEVVVLLGNSGGGSLMAAYQSQAVDPHITAVGGGPVPDAVNALPPGDLYVSTQAHAGRPEVLTAWIDPSVTDETDPLSCDPALDMYAEQNAPPYTPEFIARYRAAQRDRNDRITAWAQAELKRLKAGGTYDRSFSVHRVWADPRYLDPSLDPSDRPLNQCYLGDPRRANRAPYNIAAHCTLRTWLSMWSLQTSFCQGAPHLARITLPSLVIQGTADTGVFPSDAHHIHDSLAGTDKQLHFIDGDHYLQQPADSRTVCADLVASWIAERT